MTLTELDLGLPHVATFPCNADKSPIPQHGFHDAIRGMEWRKAPLVGFPTGAVNGVDVLDIDGDAGRKWHDAHRASIPTTRTHSTRRGQHFLFIHAPDLRCSKGKIAPGGDVRANGGYAIWWPREGFAFEDHPVADWPDWLVEEAFAACAKGRTPSNIPSGGERDERVEGVDVDAAHATEALRKLDPCAWAHKHDDWFELLMGCKAAGIDCEDFVEWSIGDPEYANDAEIIRVKWNSISPRHPGAFLKALKGAGIKLKRNQYGIAGGPTPSSATPTIDLRARTDGLRAHLAAEPTDDRLFTVAATFGEIILEGRIQRWVANDLLEGACQANGLWKSLGPDRCKRTIANGYRHVEEKYLGER
jgi:hypothetical protein